MKQPHNQEAEEAVLGAMLSAPRAVLAAQDEGLHPDHFYRPSLGVVCKAIYELDAKGEKPDTITVNRVLEEWGKGDKPLVNTLASMAPGITNAGRHARIVIDVAAERALQLAAQRISDLAESGTGSAADKIAEAERIVGDVSTGAETTEWLTIGAQTLGAFEEIKRAYETGKQRVGLKTGFKRFDEMTHGLHGGQLVIIAARPGAGKSTFAQNIAENVAEKGKKVAIFSLEMGADEIGLRMLSSLSGVEHSKITDGAQLDKAEWLRLKEAHTKLNSLPIYTEDGSVGVSELRAKSRRQQRSQGLDLLIVDYLQLLVGSGQENRNNEVGEMTRALKLLARELEIPVIVLSQLNRAVEHRQVKKPMLADLRDSGSIEQDADIVAFIYREEMYDPDCATKGEAELIVAKQRSGETGVVRLTFAAGKSRFRNLADKADQQQAATVAATTDEVPF